MTIMPAASERCTASQNRIHAVMKNFSRSVFFLHTREPQNGYPHSQCVDCEEEHLVKDTVDDRLHPVGTREGDQLLETSHALIPRTLLLRTEGDTGCIKLLQNRYHADLKFICVHLSPKTSHNFTIPGSISTNYTRDL